MRRIFSSMAWTFDDRGNRLTRATWPHDQINRTARLDEGGRHRSRRLIVFYIQTHSLTLTLKRPRRPGTLAHSLKTNFEPIFFVFSLARPKRAVRVLAVAALLPRFPPTALVAL